MKNKGEGRYPGFIGLRVEQDLLEALEKAAVEEDRPVASIVRIALKVWLEDRKKKSSKKTLSP